MSWSIKLGRLAGIPLFVHWTFLILLAFIGVRAYAVSGEDLGAALRAVLMVVAVFGCVVLHELGHALMARRFGVPTADITLLPIGGVARLQRIPEKPGQELLVALAGPAVNVVIAAVLVGGLLLSRNDLADMIPSVNLFDPDDNPFATLAFINVFLVLFNLIPAFPMDGGRVLRALLAMAMPYARATRLAATIGQSLAIGFGFLGLVSNPFLLLIALFVWIGAEAEARQVEERVNLQGARIRDAMLTEYHTLAPDDSLGHAASLLLAGSQQDFPVVEDADRQKPVGVLTRSSLMDGLSKAGRDGRVSDFSRPKLGTIEVDAPIVPALARLREGEGPCLQVVDGLQRPIGLLTLENIGEFIMVRTALQGSQAPEARAPVPLPFESGRPDPAARA
ncbi:site-2 protease family protein [Tautonia plasticadhaerens]|uniref:Zinc metalloprotease n=1 Tax=Tautonia plasticadhaerens TaxID=2527974 RepID=A0A518H111_9BACT|nr:site-2 protease family protein [Tautonia plasticadhaerens]QDV34508.1 Putative zinc metalloprotease Rip3 [Tautonia plasticadhaerens]